jgi:hypothetical protein
LRELRWDQVVLRDGGKNETWGYIRLNPEGRAQTKKRGATVPAIWSRAPLPGTGESINPIPMIPIAQHCVPILQSGRTELCNLLNLERETRLELATPTLARSCSTN